MSTKESVASKKIKKQNSLSNNAQSYIRKSGRNAGFTGKKLSIFVMVITATIMAMINAPTLAYGIRRQADKTKLAWRQAGFIGNINAAKLTANQKSDMTNVREYAIDINRKANAVTLQKLKQANETKRVTNNIASKAAAANAIRSVLNFPISFLSTLTGVGEGVLSIISKTSNNTKRTAAATTETIAKGAENVGATARTVTGSMKNTAKFLGPFAFLFTMISIMAGATGVRASILKQITSMLSGMMSKGIPVTKSVLDKVFNMMYNEISGKSVPTTKASNRFTNITNNNKNNKNNYTATSM